MRKTFLFAVLTLSCTTTAATFAGDDDLFSTIRLDSTSSNATTPSQPVASTPRPQRRTADASSTLQTALLAAGYSARVDQTGTISISLSRSDWSATVTFTQDDVGRQLRLAMQLATISDDNVIAPSTLRELLEANSQYTAASFAISGDAKQIELARMLPGDRFDGSELRDILEAMADMAEKTKSTWNVEGLRVQTVNKTPASTTPASTPAISSTTSTPAATATTTLNGRWVASATKEEAFALQLKDDGTFRLVHVKGKTNTQSKGNFTLDGTALTLKGDDGTTLNGTITRQADGFTFALQSTAGKTISLNFKSPS